MAAVKGFESYSRSKKAKISIGWYFFFQGSVMGNWAALMPAVKSQSHVSDPLLGAALIAAIFGALLAIPVATFSSRRYGSGFATFLSCFTAIFFLPLIGVATNIGLLILAIIFLGFGLGFADISMNSQAVLCEKMNRSPTLGLFHGIFACGALVSAILCGVLLSLGASVLEEIGIICSIMLLPTILFRYWLFSSAEEQLILQSEALFIRNSIRGLHILLCCPCKYVRLLITVITPTIFIGSRAVAADRDSPYSFHSELRDSLLSSGDFGDSCNNSSSLLVSHRNVSVTHNTDAVVIHLNGRENDDGKEDDEEDEDGDNGEGESGVCDSKTAEIIENLLPPPSASGGNENEGERSGQTDWQKFSFSEPEDLLLLETDNKKRRKKSSARRSRVSKYVETTQQDAYVLIKICSLCFIAYLGEGSIGDWSAIFLSDQGASPLLCTMGFVGFQFFVAVGRYYSDYLVVEIGRRNILLLAGMVAALGLGFVVWSPSLDDGARLSVAIIGFSLCGAGLSVVSPLAISLAGSEISAKEMDSSQAIGYVSSVGYIGVLVGPPLLGGLSAVCGGLRWSFLIDAVIVFTVSIVAVTLRIKQERRRANTADFLALTETLA